MQPMQKTPTSRAVFILRFWIDPVSPDEWRGQIQHVESQDCAPIRDRQELLDFLQSYLGRAAGKKDGSRPLF
ncbi:MAG: hypothetical protein JXB15_00840 [Anaerolineales bacterium]|nr:hypothetical protein [Anaerolineales bacterium]